MRVESSTMHYRPDIDGLRAVAVWLVVLYHFQRRFEINGYMGVDIFFVISGFLITSIIQSGISNNKFSITDFYFRRIRRILPALCAVLSCTVIFSYFLFLPINYLSYAKSLIATVGFSSNIFFLHEAGYFDRDAVFKPLLHTWSLGVEEQFYIIFPVLLILFNQHFKKKVGLLILLLALISLSLNILFIYKGFQATAFYMLPMRAWELSIGSLLVLLKWPQLKKLWHIEILSCAAVIILFTGVLLPINLQDFPGVYALFPTIGTAILIYCGSVSQNTFLPNYLA